MTEQSLPYWPAAMKQTTAAAYCDMSVELFRKTCPVPPICYTASARGKRYLRSKIDAWLNSLDNPDKGKISFGDFLDGSQREA